MRRCIRSESSIPRRWRPALELGLVGAFTYQFIGHTRPATVPGAAVAEHAHEAA